MNSANFYEEEFGTHCTLKCCIFKIQDWDSSQVIVFIRIVLYTFYPNIVFTKVKFYFVLTCFSPLDCKLSGLSYAVEISRVFTACMNIQVRGENWKPFKIYHLVIFVTLYLKNL